MNRCLPLCLLAPLAWAFSFLPPAAAQIPATDNTTFRSYKADGMTDQPFSVEVLAAHRTVNNVLLVRVALTNHGTAPLTPHQDFSGDTNPTDDNRISALFVVDPNGRKKYAVIRDGRNQPLCGQVAPPLQPGERRTLDAQLLAPPDTTSAVDVYFPKATPILGVPVGLPGAGEPLADTSAVVATPTGRTVPAGSAPLSPTVAIDQPTSNNLPDVYTNQANATAPGKGIGSVQSNNTDTAFTVEVVSLKGSAAGHALLKLALTNNSSGSLDPADQFTTGVGDITDARNISGVYLVDPVSKARFNVVRDTQTHALCSKIDPIVSPGERRVLEARFPPIPATVKSVYVYFPHATPIAGVPVTP